MIILDSDHLSVLRYRNSLRATKLIARLDAVVEKPFSTTIVNVEEVMKGWMASIAKERDTLRQIAAYRELGELFTFFAGYQIVLLDAEAARRFDDFRKAKVRIGTMDLKTACIAITNDALLLTANRRDFEKVPGLRFENWLD